MQHFINNRFRTHTQAYAYIYVDAGVGGFALWAFSCFPRQNRLARAPQSCLRNTPWTGLRASNGWCCGVMSEQDQQTEMLCLGYCSVRGSFCELWAPISERKREKVYKPPAGTAAGFAIKQTSPRSGVDSGELARTKRQEVRCYRQTNNSVDVDCSAAVSSPRQ